MSNLDSLKALDHFIHLLGDDVLFVPVIEGSKKPKVKWAKLTIESMQDAGYRALFADANIAIKLGKASGGLIAIDFDVDSDAAVFLKNNEHLRQTFITRGVRGCQIFFRIEGEYPDSCKTEHFEWRADRNLSVIYGFHPSCCEYQRLRELPPLHISYDQIHWPEDWRKPGEKTPQEIFEEKYGTIFTISDQGRIRWDHYALCCKYNLEHEVLFEPALGSFYQYEESTGLWLQQTKGNVKTQLGEDIKRLSDEVDTPALLMTRSNGLLSNVAALLEGVAEKKEAFKNRPTVIHCLNGMLDLQKDQIQPFAPEFHSRNQIPIKFDPQAQCPKFIEQLLKPAIPFEDIQLIQIWGGMVLLGSNIAQKLLILSGEPGTGKGTFVRVLRQIIGARNIHELRTNVLETRFEIGQYHDKILLIGADVPGDFLQQEGAYRIKSLVGGDPLTGEIKGSNFSHSLIGEWNVIVSCNSRLRVKLDGDAGAWRRRLMIIEYKIPREGPEIADLDKILFEKEASGILNFFIAGAIQFIKQGCRIVLTPNQMARVDSLLAESDSVYYFVKDCIVECEWESITTEDLVSAYNAYCEARNWEPLSTKRVEHALPDLMMRIHRAVKRTDIKKTDQSKYKRGYKGFSINLQNVRGEAS